jgi:hypothetical protein
MSNYSTNDTPVGVGYNSDGEARAFVELSAVNVGSISATTVSATTYVGIAGGNLPTGNEGDIAYISTAPDTYASISPTATPLNLATTAIVATQISDQLGSYVTEGELTTMLAAYATTAAGNFLNLTATNLTATNYTGPGGGGGGFTLPGGSVGDILYYDSPTSVTSVAPTGAPLNLATTSYVTGQGYLTQTAADSRYLTQVNAAATYLTIADATGTYLTIPDATATYLTTSVAESDYARLASENTFTATNYFEAGLNVTGPAVFEHLTLRSNGAIQLDDGLDAETVLANQGEMCFDSDSETLAIQLNTTGVILHVGEDQFIRGEADGNRTTGEAAYISGGEGSKLQISQATNTLSQEDLRILGVVPVGFNDNTQGFIQTFGKATLDTRSTVNGGVIYQSEGNNPTVGDTLYLGTGGQLTIDKPSNNSVIVMGKVEQVGEGGIVFIDVQHGFAANDLDNVNLDGNSVVVTDDTTSSVSSLSGASGSIVYFEGTTPAPGLQQIGQIMQNAGERVQDQDIDALANVRINGTPQPEGYLFYNDSENVWSSLITGGDPGFTVKAGTETIVGVQSGGTTTFTVSNVLLSPPNTTGKGDVNTGFVFLSGTDASSTEVVGDNFGKIWVTGPDQDISDGNHLVYFSSNDTTSGTAAITVSDEALTALQTTPSYFQVISSGNITGVADEALTELGWASTGTYALSDPGGNLSLESGDSADSSVINVSGDGVYQIDATVRISNTTERGGIVFRIYRDTGSGFTDIPELRASNYASRGTGSGEGITNGSCSINTILSLNANDRLQFRAQPKTAGATSIIQQEGTYLRIIKIA